MARMTGPDCVIMGSLIKTHTHKHARAPGNGDWSGGGNRNENGEGRRGAQVFATSGKKQSRRLPGNALSYPTRHHLSRQEVARAGSQQLRAQDLPGACSTMCYRGEKRTVKGTRDGREEAVK